MAERSETFLVERSLPTERLDRFLCSRYSAVSRGAIQRLIEEGFVKVNNQRVKATHHPRAGEQIEIHFPEPRSAKAEPEDIPLDILYEDSDLLVLNKGPDIVVHPAAGNEEHTLVNALLHHCKGALSGIGGVARPGIVHRLDKETSGCLVVAKTDPAHAALSEQFAERSAEKKYLAILCGSVPKLSGEIRAPIARHPSHRKRMAVSDGGGHEAWTSYRVIERLRDATLVEATLHTGRTHQIRVHFQHIGFPIVGDKTYGKSQNTRLKELANYAAPRQMLHSRQLAFTHPRSGQRLSLTAPLPEDFEKALAALRAVT